MREREAAAETAQFNLNSYIRSFEDKVNLDRIMP